MRCAFARLVAASFALLVAPTATAQPDDPLSFTADDFDDLTLNVSGTFQFRHTITIRDGVPPPDEEFDAGFAFRRLRPRFAGATPGNKLFYEIEMELASGEGRLLDAMLDFKLAEGWKLRIGQFPFAFFRESVTSNARLLVVDRPSIGANVNPTRFLRVQGLQLQRDGDHDRTQLTLSGGTRSFNSSFDSSQLGTAITLRYERALMGGSPKTFDRLTSPPGTKPDLLVGGAGHYEVADSGGDRAAWTADVTYRGDGVVFNLAGVAHVAEDLNLRGFAEHAWGVTAQAGFYLTETVEPFMRYEWGTTSDSGEPDLSLITAGFNWYISGFALKFAADVSYAFNPISDSWDRSSDGLLMDFPGRDGEVVVRTQIQLLF